MRIAVFLLCTLVTSSAVANELANGIYAIVAKDGKSGIVVTRADTEDQVVLGELATAVFGTPELKSVANDNETFFLRFADAGPFPDAVVRNRFAVYINGVCVVLQSNGHLDKQRRLTLSGEFTSLTRAKLVASALSITAQLRKHPGHQLSVRWVPKKRTFTPSEPVELTLTVENVGVAPIKFGYGGSDRGARENKFAFTAQTEWPNRGKAVPDTGDAEHEGGLIRFITLEPGATFTATVNISDWFKFPESDYYVITCLYHIELQATNTEELEAIWDEYLAGQCRLRIRK